MERTESTSRSWLIAADKYPHKPNGDRLTSEHDRGAVIWYRTHPDAWDLVEVVPRSVADSLAQAIEGFENGASVSHVFEARDRYRKEYPREHSLTDSRIDSAREDLPTCERCGGAIVFPERHGDDMREETTT